MGYYAKEYWMPVKEDPDYEVSSYGNVRRIKDKRYMSQSDNKNGNGYLRVALRGIKYYTHRLVVHAFFDCDIKNMDINHIDGNKHNNFVGNLELCTRKENIQHAVKNSMFKHTCRGLTRVVRCEDCIHRDKDEWCMNRPPDFYCADGKLR